MEEFALEPGEKIIASVRQHLFVLFFRLVPFALLALLPFVLLGLGNAALSSSLSSPSDAAEGARASLSLAGPLARFALGFWWLFLWMATFSVLIRYYLTVWVITSSRIVDIRQSGFFSRTVSSFLLIRVQDITTDVHGIFGTLIGFGTLHVETAGSDNKFSMDNLKDPTGVRDLIMNQVALLHTDGVSPSSGI